MILVRVFVVAFLFLYLNITISAYGEDFLSQIHPYISVREDYSDNLNLTAENKKDDFITTTTPGLKFSNMDAKSGVDLDASAGIVLYNQHSNLNYISANANLNAKYLTSSHVNFYIKNWYVRSDDPREREFLTTTADNKFVLATETQRAVYWRNVVEPTVEYQFGQEDRIGVKYRNNIYRPDSSAVQNSIENYINPFVSYWFNRQNGIYLDYAYTNGYFENAPDLNGHKVSAAYMIRFNPKATASLNGAYTNQTFAETTMDYEVYDASLGISYIFSPTFSASAQAGYYWMNSKIGLDNNQGITFKADLTNLDAQTTYRLSIQGGYTQDYFTSLNLGFRKYYRATGTINHFLERRFSIGALGSVEKAESGLDTTIWQVGANAAYQPLKWLKFSLEYIYNQQQANIPANEYKENRAMLMVTATY